MDGLEESERTERGMTDGNGNGAPPAVKYRPSEDVKRTQRILEQIEERRLERARLTAENLRRQVEIDRDDREAQEVLRKTVVDLEEELRRKISELKVDYARKVAESNAEMNARRAVIDRLDTSLDQLSKQLQAEIAKVDPALKRAEAVTS